MARHRHRSCPRRSFMPHPQDTRPFIVVSRDRRLANAVLLAEDQTKYPTISYVSYDLTQLKTCTHAQSMARHSFIFESNSSSAASAAHSVAVVRTTVDILSRQAIGQHQCHSIPSLYSLHSIPSCLTIYLSTRLMQCSHFTRYVSLSLPQGQSHS
jgi:hypothetical protein